jgi:hypothetical protein
MFKRLAEGPNAAIPFLRNFFLSYTAFHIKLPFLNLDCTASAKCRYQSYHSMDNQQKKEHLMKSGIASKSEFDSLAY